MKEAKRISKRFGILIMIFTILLFGFIYFIPDSLAISAEKGNFVILGRAENNELVDEKVDLWTNPGVNDIVQARLQSGTQVLVLDKAVLEIGTFYIVSTVGKEGGMIGWVSEEYIYEITVEPPRE